VSRASYGITFSTKFDAEKHLEKDKIFCPRECYDKAMNQMEWFLKRVRRHRQQLPFSASQISIVLTLTPHPFLKGQ